MFNRIFKRLYWLYLRLVSTPLELALISGVILGKNCQINKGISFSSEPYLITIGDDFYSSSNIQFITHDGSVNVLRNMHVEYKNIDFFQPIVLGDNVFLGYGVIVLLGTIIGNNVIVGAGSIVKGHLKDNSVYAGTPVKYICSIEKYIEKNKGNFLYTKGLSNKEKEEYIKKNFGILKF